MLVSYDISYNHFANHLQQLLTNDFNVRADYTSCSTLMKRMAHLPNAVYTQSYIDKLLHLLCFMKQLLPVQQRMYAAVKKEAETAPRHAR